MVSDVSEAAIIESWKRNAAPWTTAVREQRIESRRRTTDAAIVEAVLARKPRSVIDMGCGEGWLARVLASHGLDVLGVDAEPSLIDEARTLGGDYCAMNYDDIAAGKLEARADAVVCNFSLLGDTSVEALLRAVPGLLLPGGALLVQTLHPREACGELPYETGWRTGSWQGFGPEFTHPAPWYFRTFEAWADLFDAVGLLPVATVAPSDVRTGKPMSAIFVAVPKP
jgi:2-polyprenyl-3-methyl-5-hydroxy-6-metoxy-1,4-benzoquinol methylase